MNEYNNRHTRIVHTPRMITYSNKYMDECIPIDISYTDITLNVTQKRIDNTIEYIQGIYHNALNYGVPQEDIIGVSITDNIYRILQSYSYGLHGEILPTHICGIPIIITHDNNTHLVLKPSYYILYPSLIDKIHSIQER